jgi:hypothetical protein
VLRSVLCDSFAFFIHLGRPLLPIRLLRSFGSGVSSKEARDRTEASFELGYIVVLGSREGFEGVSGIRDR